MQGSVLEGFRFVLIFDRLCFFLWGLGVTASVEFLRVYRAQASGFRVS